jgi:hypothetical protein
VILHNALKLEVDTQLAFTKNKELGWLQPAKDMLGQDIK